MIKAYINKHKFAFKWLSIAFLIKLILFIFFAYNFQLHWTPDWIVNSIFITSGDTSGYYAPVEAFVNEGEYNSFCRMPGLLPIYGPLYFFFGAAWGKTLIILIQLLTGVVSVYVVAKIALQLFKNIQLFYFTFFIYAFSSFVSIWDHYGYSDSFSVSFLIFSIYFLMSFISTKNYKHLFWSGFFITWSVFFRPIHGLVLPLMILILFTHFPVNFKLWIKSAFVFSIPFIFFISIWTIYNYSKSKKIIPLQGPLSECYINLTKERLAIRELIIAGGGDIQRWIKGSEGEWFFVTKSDSSKSESKYAPNIYSSTCTIDSLISLKTKYAVIKSDTLPSEVLTSYKTDVINSTTRYINAYKEEHFFRYYFINPLNLIRKFAFPTRLDNLPFPKFSEMKFYHKAIKFGYLVLLLYIMILGSIGILLTFSKKNLIGLIPIILIVYLAGIVGYTEQRYLLPAYPFMCIFAAYTFNLIKSKFFKR